MDKDQTRQLTIISPATGKTCELDHADQGIYSQLLRGPGRLIHLSGSTLIAPLDGIVSGIYPAQREVTITVLKGPELILSLLGDTPDYHGEGIQWQVSRGQTVSRGQCLATLHHPLLKTYLAQLTLAVILRGVKTSHYAPSRLRNVVAGEDPLFHLYI